MKLSLYEMSQEWENVFEMLLDPEIPEEAVFDTIEMIEADMISGINAHRAVRAAQAISRDELIAERVAADRAAREDMERDYKASEAIKRYILVCLATMCFAAFSPFPVWAAATFCLGGAVFPASYIFRLYFPINESED